MASAVSACLVCKNPLPANAAFCPTCGRPTPPVVTGVVGENLHLDDADREEHRRRLQKALGETYQVRDLLGVGGFAEVYAAWDPRLKREVAIKVLRADLAPSPVMLDRFRLEAEAVAKLRHPNIIPIYTVGEGEGLVYFVMPRIDGESLAATLARETRLPVAESRRVLLEAAAALHEAHTAGYVHRDVKPENIMLDGKKRRVLVMDFGIAKAVSADGALTSTGMIVGTPQFMSPEQASGARDVDHRSDQYALALVGYRMLAGVLPFEGKTPQEVIVQQITTTPRPIIEVMPAVPEELSAALARALQKDPARRYGSMEEFASALGAGDGEGAAGGGGTRVPFEAFEQGLEQAAAARPLVGRNVALMAIAGLVLYAATWPFVDVPPRDLPGITRDSAVSAARAFLTSAGASGSFQEIVRYVPEGEVRGFLQQYLPPAQRRNWFDSNPPLGMWHMRWLQPSARDDWRVGVDRTGVRDFSHGMDDAAAGASLTREQARAIADSFVAARGVQLAAFHETGASDAQRPARVDHHFEWEQGGSVVAWRGSGGGGVAGEQPGAMRVSVDVRGDKVGGYHYGFHAPDEYAKGLTASTVPKGLFTLFVMLGLLGFAIRVVAMGNRSRDIQVRPALVAALSVGGLVALSALSSIGGTRYAASIEQAGAMAWVLEFGNMTVGAAFVFGGMFVCAAAGESLARAGAPGLLSGYTALLRGRPFTAAIARAVAAGLALGLALLGLKMAIRVMELRNPEGLLGSTSYSGALNESLPLATWLDAATFACGSGLMLLYLVPQLTRWLRSRWAAIVVIAVVAASIDSIGDNLTLLTFARTAALVGVSILGFSEFGVIGYIVGSILMQAVPASVALTRSGETGLVVFGVVSMVLVLAPVVVPVVVWRRVARRFG